MGSVADLRNLVEIKAPLATNVEIAQDRGRICLSERSATANTGVVVQRSLGFARLCGWTAGKHSGLYVS
jgi:hypothetical protein